jgi:hypothetical protein
MNDLSSVKPGDKVIRVFSGIPFFMEIDAVDKVHKRYFTLKDSAVKYSIKNGWPMGESRYSNQSVQFYDEKIWKEYLQNKHDRLMRQQLSKFNWLRCDIEIVRKAFALLPVIQEENEVRK